MAKSVRATPRKKSSKAKAKVATTVIGWREWGCFPVLGVPLVKVKVDSGARTSSLHATGFERFKRAGGDWLRFDAHTGNRDSTADIACEAPLADIRQVTDSGGHRERRFVIITPFTLGHVQWDIELTLTDRADMTYRMLLGRKALSHRFLLDVSHSYLHGKPADYQP